MKFDYSPAHDACDEQPWSEMDLEDLRTLIENGRTIEDVAEFLCRQGSVEDVERKARELGLWPRKA